MPENKIKTKIATHHLDATEQTLGRLATKIAGLLIGKHKPTYLPYKDEGDRVIVSNVDKIKIYFRKLEQKKYYRYSGYPGGLKHDNLSELFIKRPDEVLRRAVYQMLPKNKLRKSMIKRLVIEIKK